VSAALSGDVVYVLPGTYSIPAGITLPNDVGMRGLNHKTTLISSAVTADTVLLTMGTGCIVENLAFSLTSTGHHTLTGVLFPGTTATSSKIEGCDVFVDNSTASDLGTSNVYGVHSTGNGGSNLFDSLVSGIIRVTSAGLGNKRAVLVDTDTAIFSCRDVLLHCMRTGAGLGSYIGGETNQAGSTLHLHQGQVDGFSADISQTAGTLIVGTSSFINHTANLLGFSSLNAPVQLQWGDNGAIPSGTRYMYRGTATSSTAFEPKTHMSNTVCLLNLVIRAAVGPGAARVDTWTVRINGIDTALTGSLAGAATSSVISNISVTVQAGDDISIKMVCAASSTTADVQVMVNAI
jgi:hypothetical protein